MSDQNDVNERQQRLDVIAAQIKVCTKCQLHEGRTRAVPGAGPVNTDILFIGEGPGYHEDKQGLPFVGQSGKFLEEMLALIGLNRNQVFITNVVKCRPPENRDPQPVEVETCTSNYLFHQIELLAPKVIVTLGRYSMGLFFPGAKISAIHGQPKLPEGRYYLPLYHPAAVLRNMALKPQMEADVKKIPGLLAEIQAKLKAQSGGSNASGSESEKPGEPPKQLSLF